MGSCYFSLKMITKTVLVNLHESSYNKSIKRPEKHIKLRPLHLFSFLLIKIAPLLVAWNPFWALGAEVV